MSPSRRKAFLHTLICFGLGMGCGCADGEALVPVSGVVTLNGVPVTHGSVSFRPDASKGNSSQHHPTGEIDSKGNYFLVAGGKKGAPPGKYKVLVFVDENTPPGSPVHPTMPRWLVPAHYTNEKTTPLSVDVLAPPGQGNYDLKLTK